MFQSIRTAGLVLAAIAAGQLCSAQEYFVKHASIPADATIEQRVDIASRVVPTPMQLDWQKLELTAFLHFGVNTFTGREWGDGSEDPNVFNPVNLDTDQWCRVLKDAGVNMVILTAKHHDGFCLWQSDATDHCVKSSKWRGGNGDVLADLRKSCDKYGLKLGVYLSPWDRNSKVYGDSPKYNDLFVAQLTELLTRYGTIDEVWFDGACGEGPNGKKQVYDWDRVLKVIHELQPGAVTAIYGDDVRWVGNEAGRGRATEWSCTPLCPGSLPNSEEINKATGVYQMAKDLGSRDLLAKATDLYWYPSEVDVSIRDGWFFHPDQNPKKLSKLVDIYLSSVGQNSVLLLNVPPDTDGKIHANDAARLAEFGQYLRDNFSQPVAAGSVANCVMIQEDVSKGQRVEAFELLARVGADWRKVAEGTTIGYKRMLTFPAVKADEFKVNVLQSRGEVHLSAPKAYYLRTIVDAEPSHGKYKELAHHAWSVVEADGLFGSKAIDGLDCTFWKSEESMSDNGPLAKSITVDMGKVVEVAGFSYSPYSESKDGLVFNYTFEVSADADAAQWSTCVKDGEFGNIENNPIKQNVIFDKPVKARYFRFSAKTDIKGNSSFVVGDLGIIVENR